MAGPVASEGDDVLVAVDYKDMQSVLNVQLNIRVMCHDDLPRVMTIEEDSYPHPWTLGIFRDCMRVGYRCWVCELEGEVVGYGIVMIAASEAHILNLCIHPDYHSRGLGRALLSFLIEQSQHAGSDMVLLEVRESNKSAISLYQTSGFHELGVRREYYPADEGREDAIILAKYLESLSD